MHRRVLIFSGAALVLAVGFTALAARLSGLSAGATVSWAVAAAVVVAVPLVAWRDLRRRVQVGRSELRTQLRDIRQVVGGLSGQVTAGTQQTIASARSTHDLSRQLAQVVQGEVRRAADHVDLTEKRLRVGASNDVAQLEALMQLFRLSDLREAIPRTRGYPASPDALLALVDLVRTQRPDLYLEFGSGTSTVVVASAVRALGSATRVVAIEHDADYAEQTRELARRHGLADLVEVRVAPLVPLPDQPDRLWFDASRLTDLHDVGVAFVDGPPGHIGPQSRHPALAFLHDRLAAHAFVVVDDADRGDEKDLAETWALDPRVVSVRNPVAEKGLVVLELSADHGRAATAVSESASADSQ